MTPFKKDIWPIGESLLPVDNRYCVNIFSAEIYVDDRFFFYKDGIFPAILCNQTGGKIKIAVMVLGFGLLFYMFFIRISGTKTFDNQSYDYWLVQPIGEKFKNWGRNGVAEISDLCYKVFVRFEYL